MVRSVILYVIGHLLDTCMIQSPSSSPAESNSSGLLYVYIFVPFGLLSSCAIIVLVAIIVSIRQRRKKTTVSLPK